MSLMQLRPSFSESWYRVAGTKVRLRTTAQVSRQHYRGERWYVVRDPAGNQYHRLSDTAYRFIALLDGKRTVAEAWEHAGGALADDAPTQPEVIQILSQLYAANLIDTEVTPDNAVLLRRHKQFLKRRLQSRLMQTLFPRIPIWDPDRFLKRWMPVVGPAISTTGGIVWLVLVALAGAVIFSKWPEFWSAAKNSIDPSNWLLLWVTFAVIKFIHELGHAFTTRRFGGEVHEMGIMFLVFIPTPYVDASSAWSFPNKWHRFIVGAGGMLFELVVAALAVFVWASTSPQSNVWGLPINQLAYNVMLIASVTTVLFNINPLLRYDGYYMLSDYLEIPNLQKKSTDYTLGLIKRHVFRVKQREPLPTVTARFWLFNYACTSSVYRIFIGLLIVVLVAYQVPILGVLMAIGGVIMWLGIPLFKSIKYLALEPELHRKRARAWAFTLATTAVVVGLVGFLPVWFAVRAEAIIEPERREVLFARTPGFVKEIRVKDQQDVAAGDVLMVLEDRELLANLARQEAAVRELQIRLRLAGTDAPAQKELVQTELTFATQTLAEYRRRAEELTVRAPIAGRLMAPMLEEYLGRYVEAGQQMMMVASFDRLVVRAAVPQTDAELVPLMGVSSAEVVPVGKTPWGFLARLSPITLESARLIPAAQDRLAHPALGQAGGGQIPIDSNDPQGTRPQAATHELVGLLPAGTDVLPGQRAMVRIELPPRSIGWQVWRRFLQTIQSHSNTPWR